MELATYKGRTYRLLWSGKTRYGHRAKLGFRDGTKEFWVDLSRVGRVAPEPDGEYAEDDGPSFDSCAECGERPGVAMVADSSGLRALCCHRCASYSAYERSFA